MNSIKNFFNRRNIYFTALIVVMLITVAGLWQYKNYVDERNAQLQYEEEQLEMSQDEKQSDVGLQIIQENEEKQVENTGAAKEVTNISQSKPKSTKSTKAEPAIPAIKVEEPNMQTMISPVFGTVNMDYSDEALLYSKTLDLWTTHFGLDIKADEGTSVRAAMDGVVAEVANDPQWGLSIILNHGNGIKTKYSNLSTLDMVKVGQKVTKGDVISGVGKTALCEVSDDAHVHFEVIKNDKNLDPKAYLPKQSIKR